MLLTSLVCHEKVTLRYAMDGLSGLGNPCAQLPSRGANADGAVENPAVVVLVSGLVDKNVAILFSAG